MSLSIILHLLFFAKNLPETGLLQEQYSIVCLTLFLKGDFFDFFSTLFITASSSTPQIPLCWRKLGSNLGSTSGLAVRRSNHARLDIIHLPISYWSLPCRTCSQVSKTEDQGILVWGAFVQAGGRETRAVPRDRPLGLNLSQDCVN